MNFLNGKHSRLFITTLLFNACCLLFGSTLAQAQTVGSLGYYNLSAGKLDLGAVGGSIGYEALRFNYNDSSFTLIPELRFGFGVNDDSLTLLNTKTEYELDYFYGISLRGQWNFAESAYLFINPSYTRFSIDSGSPGSFSFNETGIGAGFGFRFSEKNSIEAAYEDIDGDELISFSVRHKF